MSHLKTVLTYCLLCGVLLCAALAMKNLPESKKVFAIAGLLAAINAAFLIKSVRAHK